MKKNYKKIIVLAIAVLVLTTGCTKTLTVNKKEVKNPETGQSLTKNILCQPENEKIRKIYEENKVNIKKLPKCSKFSVTSGGYEGLWESIFVKPLAFVILLINNYVKNAGLALIITSLLIRLLAYPLTRKTAMQSELLKEAQPELNKLEKKYEGKTDQESVMKKSQEMSMIYKKYKINPISGCIFAFIQLPLFIAFFEAINRVPVLFEGEFLGLQLGTTPQVGIMAKLATSKSFISFFQTFFTNGNWIYLILILLVGATTYFSFKMNQTTQQESTGPMKNMSIIMTVMILVMGFFMTSALCIYWITTNVFTIIQNLLVKRRKKYASKK